jgi:hypothetical protein
VGVKEAMSDVIDTTECPKCHAKPGKMCDWGQGGDHTIPHHARIGAYWESRKK